MWRLRTEVALPLLNGILGISDRLEPRDTLSLTSGGRREGLSDGSAENICAMLVAKLMYLLRLCFSLEKRLQSQPRVLNDRGHFDNAIRNRTIFP